MSAAAEPAPLAVSSCVHPARPWVPGLSGFSGPQNTPQPPYSPVSPPRTGALGQHVGALPHAAGGCGARPEGAREHLCPPSAPFPRFGLSLSVVLAVVRSCSSSFVSRGCRPGALGGQAPAVTRVQCVNPLPGTGDCSLVRALCLAQLTGVARKRTRSLVWCHSFCDCYPEDAARSCGKQGCARGPTELYRFADFKSCWPEGLADKQKKSRR